MRKPQRLTIGGALWVEYRAYWKVIKDNDCILIVSSGAGWRVRNNGDYDGGIEVGGWLSAQVIALDMLGVNQ